MTKIGPKTYNTENHMGNTTPNMKERIPPPKEITNPIFLEIFLTSIRIKTDWVLRDMNLVI